ncbi:MAG: anti-sigma factor [Candidatus Kapaibacterium sp.]
MKELEKNILRYLDGEMTPQEEAEIQQLLLESSDARHMLREFEDIRSAARLFPTLTQPTPEVESLLFQHLFEEESIEEEEDERRAILPLLYRISASMRSTAILVPALLLIIATGTGLFLTSNNPDESINAANQTIAAAIQPPSLPQSVETSSASTAEISPDMAAETTLPSLSTKSGVSTQPIKPSVQYVERIGEDVTIRGFKSTQDSNTLSTDVADPLPQPEENIPFAENNPTITANPNDVSFRLDQEDNGGDKAELPRQLIDPSLLSTIDPPEENRAERGLTASYRHGLAASVLDNEVLTAQDMSIRIDGHIGGQHRLSVAVGQSPLLVWKRKAQATTKDEKGSSTASITYNQSSRFDGELWAGVGYSYAMVENNRIRVEAGVSAGVGEESFRYGIELPSSVVVNDRLSVNVVPFLSRVAPYDQQLHDVSQTETEQTLDFTTFGAQIGVSFALGM